MDTFLILGKGQTPHRQSGWDTCYFWPHGRVVSLTLQHSILRWAGWVLLSLSPRSPACTDESRPQPLARWCPRRRGSVYGALQCAGARTRPPSSALSLSCLHCEIVLLACSSKAGAPSFAHGHSNEWSGSQPSSPGARAGCWGVAIKAPITCTFWLLAFYTVIYFSVWSWNSSRV